MRKVREIFRALGLDNKYSKETVLEAYLNTIPLTGIVHGMEAGSLAILRQACRGLDPVGVRRAGLYHEEPDEVQPLPPTLKNSSSAATMFCTRCTVPGVYHRG